MFLLVSPPLLAGREFGHKDFGTFPSHIESDHCVGIFAFPPKDGIENGIGVGWQLDQQPAVAVNSIPIFVIRGIYP
jgi:hypothetical protein